MEAIARLRESVNGASPGAATSSSATPRARDRLVLGARRLRAGAGDVRVGRPGPAEPDQRGLDALGVVLAAGMSLPLLARRRAPGPRLPGRDGLAGGGRRPALSARLHLGPGSGAVHAGARSRTPGARAARVGLAVGCFAGVAVALASAYDDVLSVEIGFIALVWLAIWFAGRGSRLKQEHITSLEDRAERAEGGRARADAGGGRGADRIARDLHDSAGHAINVILVEAGAARLLRERDPDRAEQALETIEVVAREQIGEIDRLVHALRADEDADRAIEDCELPGDPPKGRPPGMHCSSACGPAAWTWRWSGRASAASWARVGRASYRILQEALTNALRHGTGSATVVVRHLQQEVEFTIENPIANGGEPARALRPDRHARARGAAGRQPRGRRR